MVDRTFSHRLGTRVTAILLCAGLGATLVPDAVAQTDHTAVASLAAQLADAQTKLNDLQLQEGGLRQQANKAIDELNTATQEANDAQAKVVDARTRLDQSQKDVESAQGKLNDLARSAYSQGSSEGAVVIAAGQDAVADSLARASYLRSEATKQKKVVDDLDAVRTRNANEESTLRKLAADAEAKRDAAKNSKDGAIAAIEDATAKIRDLQGAISQAQQAYDDLQAKINAEKAAAAMPAAPAAAEAAPAATTEAQPAAAPASAATASATSTTTASELLTKRSAAVAVAKEKSEAALSAAQDAQVKQAAGTADATQAISRAASLATDASDAIKVVEDLTTQLQEFFKITGLDNALNGLTSAGLAALAAGLKALLQGQDPVAAATAIIGEQTPAILAAVAATTFGAQLTSLIGNLQNNTTALDRVSDGTDAAGVAASVGGGTTTSTTSTSTSSASTASSASTSTVSDTDSDTEDTTSTASSTSESTESSDSEVSENADANTKIEAVIARAKSQLGVRYSWGGGNIYGPTLGVRDGGVADQYGDYANAGYDCSGLMVYAFYAAGVILPKYSGSQYTAGTQVPSSQAKRGDMLFWGSGGTQHVALYLGDGQMIEAPYSGGVVRITSVRYSGMTPYAVRMFS